MSDNRLNALVHEALGAVWCQEPLGPDGMAVNAGEPYMVNSCAYDFAGRTRVPRPENFAELYDGPEYDTDWNETGPLIDKYDLDIESAPGRMANARGVTGAGETTPEAVCDWILRAAEAGKL